MTADDMHPFVRGLLQNLPPPGAEWPVDFRVRWLTAAANIFGLMYADPIGEDGLQSIVVQAATPPTAAEGQP